METGLKSVIDVIKTGRESVISIRARILQHCFVARSVLEWQDKSPESLPHRIALRVPFHISLNDWPPPKQ